MENKQPQSGFSVEALRALMANSPAYAGLTEEQKQAIEKHIANNERPVLLYLFQQFSEEAQVLKNSREDLARKVVTQEPINPKIFKNL